MLAVAITNGAAEVLARGLALELAPITHSRELCSSCSSLAPEHEEAILAAALGAACFARR